MVNHTLGLLLLAIFAGTELHVEADLSSAPVDVSGTAWFVGRLFVSPHSIFFVFFLTTVLSNQVAVDCCVAMPFGKCPVLHVRNTASLPHNSNRTNRWVETVGNGCHHPSLCARERRPRGTHTPLRDGARVPRRAPPTTERSAMLPL
jgi:hypothetical protein